MTTEIKKWHPMADYNGLYEVSNYGEVRTVERVLIKRDGKKYPIPQREIKRHKTKGGLKVTLIKKGKKTSARVHNLIWTSLNKVAVDRNFYIAHLDGDNTNNAIWNLIQKPIPYHTGKRAEVR